MTPESEDYQYIQALLNSAVPQVDLPLALRDWILQAGAVQRLMEDGSDEAINILETAVRSCPAPDAARQAMDALRGLAQQNHLTARISCYRLVLEEGFSQLIAWIQESKLTSPLPWQNRCFAFLYLPLPEYQTDDPHLEKLLDDYLNRATPVVRGRLAKHARKLNLEHWIEIAESLLTASPDSLAIVVVNFHGYTQFERSNIRYWLDELAQSGSAPAQDALCELFLSQDDTAASTLARQRGYLPTDPDRKALFLFLTEQWEAYEVLDFTHLHLNEIYETASPALRQRLLSHSRLSGHNEWLQGLGDSRRRWLKDMTDADWRSVIRQLESKQDWQEIWHLIAHTPPLWGARLIDLLFRANWRPQTAVDQQDFLNLVSLAKKALFETAIVSPSKVLGTPAQDILASTVRNDGKAFATGGSDQRLYLWDLPSGDRRGDLISSPTPGTRALVLSPDGLYLAAAFADQTIRIFRLEDLRLVKTLEGHTGLIRSLFFHPDGRTLFSASFDGTLRAWRFPLGPENDQLQPGMGELFAAVGSRNMENIIVSGKQVQVFRWPQGGMIQSLPHDESTTLLLSSADQMPLLAGYNQNQVVRIWNISSGRLIQQIGNPGSQISTISISPHGEFLLSGDKNGKITVWNTSTAEILETMQVHEKAVVGLHWASENTILSASQEGRLVLWDARLLRWLRLPLDQITGNSLAEIHFMAAEKSHSSGVKAWLSFLVELVRWKNRFDILLEEPHLIQLDEFDIEL